MPLPSAGVGFKQERAGTLPAQPTNFPKGGAPAANCARSAPPASGPKPRIPAQAAGLRENRHELDRDRGERRPRFAPLRASRRSSAEDRRRFANRWPRRARRAGSARHLALSAEQKERAGTGLRKASRPAGAPTLRDPPRQAPVVLLPAAPETRPPPIRSVASAQAPPSGSPRSENAFLSRHVGVDMRSCHGRKRIVE